MNIDPKQLKKMMEQMGIKTTEIDAKRVIIEKEDERIILEQPSVVQIEGKGERSFQIAAKSIRTEALVSAEDIGLVMQQAGASKEDAAAALKSADGDVAEAIMKLKKE
jgi:nascent polypeptide-associated complex subunit alpha